MNALLVDLLMLAAALRVGMLLVSYAGQQAVQHCTEAARSARALTAAAEPGPPAQAGSPAQAEPPAPQRWSALDDLQLRRFARAIESDLDQVWRSGSS